MPVVTRSQSKLHARRTYTKHPPPHRCSAPLVDDHLTSYPANQVQTKYLFPTKLNSTIMTCVYVWAHIMMCRAAINSARMFAHSFSMFMKLKSLADTTYMSATITVQLITLLIMCSIANVYVIIINDIYNTCMRTKDTDNRGTSPMCMLIVAVAYELVWIYYEHTQHNMVHISDYTEL